MRIEYVITDFPPKDQKHFAAHLEGDLRIDIANRIFFDSENILLLELSDWCQKCLDVIRNGSFVNSEYLSMDHDEPIISLKKLSDGKVQVDSIWRKLDSPFEVSENELVDAFENYIKSLKKAVSVPSLS